MDPNLTLAHITHNTSMILLHQHIAYPPLSWKGVVKLPSSCSIETCQLAAVETASIVEKYLRYTGGIVNSQFAFCAFVAARVLVVQWQSSEANTLAPAFFSLLQSLQDMSTRWLGSLEHALDNAMPQPGSDLATQTDLAARYASRLRALQSRCASDVNFASSGLPEILLDSSFEGFVEKQTWSIITHQQSGSYASLESRSTNRLQEPSPITSSDSRDNYTQSPSVVAELDRQYHRVHSNTIPASRRPRHAQPSTERGGQSSNIAAQEPIRDSQYGGMTSPTLPAPPSDMNGRFPIPGPMSMGIGSFCQAQPGLSEEDELAAMSQMLLEHQFLQLDRVIRLDGADFFNDAGDGLRLI